MDTQRKKEQQDKEKYYAPHYMPHDHYLFDCYSHCTESGNIATQSFIDTSEERLQIKAEIEKYWANQ